MKSIEDFKEIFAYDYDEEMFSKKEVIPPEELMKCKKQSLFQKLVQKLKKLLK